MNKTVLETVVERSQNLEASLKTLAYAMEAMKNIDNGEKELREIGWDVENQIEILQEYQKETIRLLEQPESDDVEGAERAEIKGKMLTKADAEALFERNAVLLDYTCNAIPFYRVIEIFGEEAAVFLEKNMEYQGYIANAKDYGSYSDAITGNFLYKCGFLKVVVHHNNYLSQKAHKESESGHVWEQCWEARCRRLDEEDAEEERKKAERKAKRAAAKAAKLAVQEGE